MSNPEFITFTGAGDGTAGGVAAMAALSSRYPIEWGILFSPARTGQPRYPTMDWVEQLIKHQQRTQALDLSAHVCGRHSRDLIEFGTIVELQQVFESGAFKRVQVNTADGKVHQRLPHIRAWADNLGLEVIVQTRDPLRFPEPSMVRWLYDASGGRGQLPLQWPAHLFQGDLAGYAGGLNQHNVADALGAIRNVAQGRYWIDMESGVCDPSSGGYVSPERCEAVCQAVYGGNLL